MPLATGDRLGPFEVVACIGAGGMGDVYKARDTRLNRTVAIKLLHDASLRDPDARRRFEHEARAIAGLTHPHICVLYDIGEYDNEPFLVMEYLEGETLADRIARGPVPTSLALRYAMEIAAALDAAHRQGIQHRDLKPANVMLTRSGAKLLDFGIAKLRARHDEQSTSPTSATSGAETAAGIVVGTLPYMAPERIEGRPSDARADIFAFGAVLYEMLSGRRAFAGDTAASVVATILKDDPPPIDGLPPALDRLLRRCLARDPEDRWQSARDLAEALSWLSSGAGSSQVAEARRRLPWRWAALAAVAVAAVVLAIWSAYAGRGKPVVVLMDSTLPDRVYDPLTRASGGTNSDDITDALRDLPVELHKETTSSLWHREEQVLRQRPALVMMHLSSFAEPSGDLRSPLQPAAVERTREFLGIVGLGNPRTRFIVYTRGFPTEAERQAWVGDTVARFPVLQNRVQMLHIPGGDAATFRSAETRRLVQTKVREILSLD